MALEFWQTFAGATKIFRGALDLVGHPVEPLGEGFKLVARPDVDAVAERASADLRHAGLQGTDGFHHPPCQQEACQDRQPESQHHKRGGPE